MTRLLCFYDTETTGKNEPEHRFVELTCRFHDLSTGAHVDTWTRRCNPLRRIDGKAFDVHGISAEDLKNEPTFDVIAPELVHQLSRGEAVLAHNGDFFDFPFTLRELGRIGVPFTFRRTYDTMVNARWATGDGKNPSLLELCRCLDVPYDVSQAHAAEYDTAVMAQAFFEGVRLGWFRIDGITD